MATEYTEARIREARLIVARPEQVLAELEKYGDELKKTVFGGDEHLEKSLLARGEPLIDLGLARYAGEKEVVAALYQKSLATPVDHLQERYLRGEQRAHAPSLGSPFLLTSPLPILEDTGVQPLPDVTHHAPVPDPMLDEFN